MTHPMNTMTKKSVEYLTPPEIIESLGTFDLDPCAPEVQPWPTAKNTFTKKDNGLTKEWFGRVWLNPPYGREVGDWMAKMSTFGNGIALILARTDTQFFQNYVFKRASGILFIEGRLHFYNLQGERYPHNAGAPSCLVSYGLDNFLRLYGAGEIPGRLIKL